MKIISKYKDYYGYLQGVWGVDDKLVLNRSECILSDFFISSCVFPYTRFIRFYICGKVVEGVYNRESEKDKGSFLYGEELKPFHRKVYLHNDDRYYNIEVRNSNGFMSRSTKILREPMSFFDTDLTSYTSKRDIKKVECPNSKLKCPIIMERHLLGEFNREYYLYPLLKDFSIHKVFEAENIWIMLSEWVGRVEDPKDTRTNNQKVLTNGFDLKTSFRK